MHLAHVVSRFSRRDRLFKFFLNLTFTRTKKCPLQLLSGACFVSAFTRSPVLKWQYRSVVVNPGTKEAVVPPRDIQIHVKGLSLGAELKDKDGRSSLKLSYAFAASPRDDDDEEETEDEKEDHMVTKEVILGSLTPGKVNHVFPSLGSDMTLSSPF